MDGRPQVVSLSERRAQKAFDRLHTVAKSLVTEPCGEQVWSCGKCQGTDFMIRDDMLLECSGCGCITSTFQAFDPSEPPGAA